MPEQIRAYIVLIFLLVAMFYVLRPMFEKMLDRETHTACFTYWLVLTSVAFLAHNVWLYMALLCVVLFVRPYKIKPLVLFFYLFLCLPLFPFSIGGLGLNKVFEVNYYRLLILLLLLPMALQLLKDRSAVPFGKSVVDYLVLLFYLLTAILDSRGEGVTEFARQILHGFIDIVLPYYAISRGIKTSEDLKEVLAAFLAAGALLIGLAIFEHFYRWILYSSANRALGVGTGMFGYQQRASGIRSVVTQGHSIALGTIFVVLTGVVYVLRDYFSSKKIYYFVVFALIVALYATVSRGAWLGAVLSLVFLMLVARNWIANLLGFIAFGVPGLIFLMNTEFGDGFVDLLPFVGTVDATSYREMLFQNSVLVIERNLWFGSKDFLAQPEMIALMQGEGIVDMVNTYVSMGLKYGLIGLGCFVLIITIAMRNFLLIGRFNGLVFERRLGIGLAAAFSGFSFVIYTMSFFMALPYVFWILVALSSAFIFIRHPRYYN
jgi:hypothetical protein